MSSEQTRSARHSLGLCSSCGEVPHRFARRMCQPCAELAAAATMRHKVKLSRGRPRTIRLIVARETAEQARQVSPGDRCHCWLLLPCHDHTALETQYYTGQRRGITWAI